MSESDRFFVDTNVLLYSLDTSAPKKREAALLWLDALWANRAGVLSWQVLHEFYTNAVRKLRVPAKSARQLVEEFTRWQPVDMTLGQIRRGWRWTDRAKLSYWDGLIVAAAERTECMWLLSEDFQAGRRFGTVTIVNPFLAKPVDFGLASDGRRKTKH
ncbi:MAG TPA: PIN domain-containing protein [Bryobacteraceae bacterium]